MKQSLGRGLEALIPLNEKNNLQKDISEIPIDKIVPLIGQPRQVFDSAKIEELANSIREKGMIQPIIVRRKDGLFQLIAGERRLHAARLLKLAFLPALIRDYSDNEAFEVALIENIQREDLTPIEVANGYKRIIKELKLTHEELAKKVGKSRASVSNTLRLLDLPAYIIEAIEAGKIKEGHIRSLISIDNEDIRAKLFDKIMREKLTAREVEDITRSARPVKKRGAKALIFNEYKQTVKKLEESLGTKVEVKPFSKKTKNGKIIIYFYSENDFNKIYSGLIK